MPTSYTSLLGLALPVTGELSGTWGDTVNNFITQYVDAAVAGAQTISGSQTAVTLSTTTATALSQAGSGATGSAQYQIINCTGNPASALTVTVPSASKVYLVLNNTSTSQTVTVKGAATTGVTVAAGRSALIAWNGTDFELVATDDASKISGILAVANGGTGLSSGTSGGVPYFSGSATMASSAALAANALVVGGGAGAAPSTITTGTGVTTALGVNTGSAGAFVVNGGALGTPSSGTLTNATGLPLSTGVTGTLPVTSGGTGQTTYTDGQLLIGNTTGNTLNKATLTAGSGVSITNGAGSITIAATGSGGTVTSVDMTVPSFLSVSGNPITTSGTFAVSLSGTALPAANGGTGQTSYAVGDILFASTTSALSKLADVATGNALISGGVGVAPSYGKIGLTTHVSGTLPVANGGTGLTSGTSGGVLYYSATGTLASSAALAASALVIGGGAGVAPSTTTTGTGVVTAIGSAVNTTGGLVTQSGTLAASSLLLGGGSGTAISSTTTGTGVVTALGNNANATGGFATVNGSATLTNKRIDPRVSSTTSAASVTPDISSFDQYAFTALAAGLTINAPTGTPVDGNQLIFRILDNGVSRTLTWNATYTAIGVTLPTATTASKTTYVGCIYNAANTRWDVVAVATQA